MYRALFKPQMNDVAALHKFLLEKLQEPRRLELGHAGRIMIELYAEDFPNLDADGIRDECWKTAEWVRHKNPIGDNLSYQVTGYEGTKIIYTSGCKICKGNRGKEINTPHYEHDI